MTDIVVERNYLFELACLKYFFHIGQISPLLEFTEFAQIPREVTVLDSKYAVTTQYNNDV